MKISMKQRDPTSVTTSLNLQVTARLLWVLQNVSVLKDALQKNKVCFGTIDTWLVYKLTGGKLHATDASNAACTGFFDPFTMEWASWAFHILGVPQKILPKIRDSSGDFGETDPNIFGHSIPIRSCVSITFCKAVMGGDF